MDSNRNNKGQFVKGNSVNTGKIHDPETIRKIKATNVVSSFWRGKHLAQETRLKMSNSKIGAKHWNWQGGITKASHKLRNDVRLKQWRRDVLERDGHKCVLCNEDKERLCTDHIKPFAYYPESRFDVENGRTLCYPCHFKTPTFGGLKKSDRLVECR